MFFLQTKVNIGSLLLKTSPFWKHKIIGGKWSRDRYFTGEDMENILLYIFCILLSTI